MMEKDRDYPLKELTEQIIGAAIEVHRNLGPGLLESVYETCLAYELRQLGLQIEQQKALPIVYKEISMDHGYRIDFRIVMPPQIGTY